MDNETRKSGSASTPVLRFCTMMRAAFPERGYDLSRSHDENVFRSGQASAVNWLCKMAEGCFTLEELLEELNSRFRPEEPMEGNGNVFRKETVDSRR